MTETITTPTAPDAKVLREKAACAKDAVADLASEAKHYAADRISVIREQASTKAKQINDNAVDWVQHNPYKALAIAAGSGMLIGMILKRRW